VTSQPVRLTDPSGAVLPAVLAAPWVAEGVVAIGALIGAALWSQSDQAAQMSRATARVIRRAADDIIDELTQSDDCGETFDSSTFYGEMKQTWGMLGARSLAASACQSSVQRADAPNSQRKCVCPSNGAVVLDNFCGTNSMMDCVFQTCTFYDSTTGFPTVRSCIVK